MSLPFAYCDKCPCKNKGLTNTARIKNAATMIKRRVSFSSTSDCDNKDFKMNHHDSHHHHHSLHTDAAICKDHIQHEKKIVNRGNTETDVSSLSSIKSLTSKEEQS